MKTILIAIFLLTSCSHFQGNANTFSDAQISSLAQEVLNHTPEHTHYVEGYKFDWVIFTTPPKDPFPKMTKKIREALKSKYAVYDDESSVPQELIVRDPQDPIGKIYRGGFQFWVEIRRISTDTIEVTYGDFEHSMAAGHQTFRYRWKNNGWQVTWKSSLTVS